MTAAPENSSPLQWKLFIRRRPSATLSRGQRRRSAASGRRHAARPCAGGG
jgi:hypothetical protein